MTRNHLFFRFVLSFLFAAVVSKAPSLQAHEGETLFIDQVKVSGRAYTHSCQYYSNSQLDLLIEFHPFPLETGSRVFVDLGWAGMNQRANKEFNDYEPLSLELEPRAFNRWQVSVSKTIAERSSALFLTGVHFVFRVESPGSPTQIFGGVEAGDQYFVRFPEPGTLPCVSADSELPDFIEWVVQIDRQRNH